MTLKQNLTDVSCKNDAVFCLINIYVSKIEGFAGVSRFHTLLSHMAVHMYHSSTMLLSPKEGNEASSRKPVRFHMLSSKSTRTMSPRLSYLSRTATVLTDPLTFTCRRNCVHFKHRRIFHQPWIYDMPNYPTIKESLVWSCD